MSSLELDLSRLTSRLPAASLLTLWLIWRTSESGLKPLKFILIRSCNWHHADHARLRCLSGCYADSCKSAEYCANRLSIPVDIRRLKSLVDHRGSGAAQAEFGRRLDAAFCLFDLLRFPLDDVFVAVYAVE